MDKVRFGRALGYGARHAAKTLVQAVDAATTPGTASAARPASSPRPASSTRVTQVRSAARVAGKSALEPVRKFSSVLWLEVTGSFFALVALTLGQALWKRHGLWRAPGETAKLALIAAMFALFAYFAVSSFVRARRRQRR